MLYVKFDNTIGVEFYFINYENTILLESIKTDVDVIEWETFNLNFWDITSNQIYVENKSYNLKNENYCIKNGSWADLLSVKENELSFAILNYWNEDIVGIFDVEDEFDISKLKIYLTRFDYNENIKNNIYNYYKNDYIYFFDDIKYNNLNAEDVQGGTIGDLDEETDVFQLL